MILLARVGRRKVGDFCTAPPLYKKCFLNETFDQRVDYHPIRKIIYLKKSDSLKLILY